MSIPDIYTKHKSDDEQENVTEENEIDDNDQNPLDDEQYYSPSKSTNPLKSSSSRIRKNHPEDLIIGDMNSGVETRSRKQPVTEKQVSLLSLTEPKNVDEAIRDKHWMHAMEEELSQIERNNTWELV